MKHLTTTLLLVGLAAPLLAQSTQQIPMPPQGRIATAQLAKGFWFAVPAGGAPFTITGVRSLVTNTPPLLQNDFTIARFATNPPTGFPVATLAIGPCSTTTVTPLNVPIQPGDVIAIWNTAASANNHHFSQGASPFDTTFACNCVTLGGFQSSMIPSTAPEIGRIEIHVAPACPAATSSTFGAGCGGLSHVAMTQPVMGGDVTLTTNNVPANVALGATVLGLIEHDPGLDLSPLGMPGCAQYVSLDATVAWIPAGGAGTTTLSIPCTANLIGLRFGSQGAVLSAGANAANALTSNGVHLTLGW